MTCRGVVRRVVSSSFVLSCGVHSTGMIFSAGVVCCSVCSGVLWCVWWWWGAHDQCDVGLV